MGMGGKSKGGSICTGSRPAELPMPKDKVRKAPPDNFKPANRQERRIVAAFRKKQALAAKPKRG